MVGPYDMYKGPVNNPYMSRDGDSHSGGRYGRERSYGGGVRKQVLLHYFFMPVIEICKSYH